MHSRPIRAVETARRLWREWLDRAEEGSGLLAYLLIDAIVDDYLPLLDIISERMDSLEDSIFGEFRAQGNRGDLRDKKEVALFAPRYRTASRRFQYHVKTRAADLFSSRSFGPASSAS